MALLKVENLSVSYPTASGPVRAVRDVSFELAAGESLALVGETGSGKSTIALSMLGLLGNGGRMDTGRISFQDTPLASPGDHSWRKLRGSKIGMVFQDARGALNPVLTVGSQLAEALRAHQRLTKTEACRTAAARFEEVGIPEPRFYLDRFPGELSGGMCQRVAIAIALCNRPSLLIADEPTSALDPGIQAQILDLLRGMQLRFGLAMLWISHDLALVSDLSERVAVMYHGRLVECGPTAHVILQPGHPYTASLMACQPDLQHHWDRRPLTAIAGTPPASGQEFPGCSFAPRCRRADSDCLRGVPPPAVIAEEHWAACLKPV